MITRSWNNCTSEPRPASNCLSTLTVLAHQSHISCLCLHSRSSNRNSRNFYKLGHRICLKSSNQNLYRNVNQRYIGKDSFFFLTPTPIDRIETEFSLEDKNICTSPVSGSSISPVSLATFDLRLARTSAAAVSNCKVD